EPGGDERVPHLYVLGALHVVEHAARVHRPLYDATCARALHERIHPAVVVGDEQDASGMPAHEEHLPDDALGHEHSRPSRQPRARTRSATPRQRPEMARPRAEAARSSGAISSRKARPSGSARPAVRPLRTTSAAPTTRQSATVSTTPLRRM